MPHPVVSVKCAVCSSSLQHHVTFGAFCVDELLHDIWCPVCSFCLLFSAGHAAMSVGFATLLSVDVALTLVQFRTVQDSLRLYSGNIMYRQLFASTRVDVVLPVLWYIDGISATLHIVLDSCSQGAYF